MGGDGNPRAVKIIDIDKEGNSFILNEKALKSVLKHVPKEMKLNVISVVGAFRTGKSFILDLFLRYLRNSSSKADKCKGEPDDTWMYKGGKLEGNNNKTSAASKEGGFGWRSGRERCTTGIWLWSEHFIRELPNSKGEKIAVLIMDTQGMFDSTLGQHLTASIFGLSALISSYSVYNLDKRVQEDNLQHLALFSEYGRVALVEQQKQQPDDVEWTSSADDPASEGVDGDRPFQRLELLVRDWQDFTDVDGELDELHEDMRVYLDEILAERDQKDLKEVREQIKLCYETVSCWLLPHPGFEVIKKTFDGDLNKAAPDFRRLVADYVRRVFGKRMVVKKLAGKPVNAMELFNFTKVYCELFKEASIFPEAQTLLAATSAANNMNAVQKALDKYKREMDKLAGSGKPYVSTKKLKKEHKIAAQGAKEVFASIATMGPIAGIKKHKNELDRKIDERFLAYLEANQLRDPFSVLAPYVVPIMIALICYAIRYVLETVCGRRNMKCLDVADFFAAMMWTIVSFLFFQLATTGYGVHQRVKVLFGGQSAFDEDD